MPEGDTILRAATVLRAALVGRTITRAHTTAAAAVERLVGETVEEVEARAKHLLIRCTGNLTLHTHMKMTGAWRVYDAAAVSGDVRARLVLEAGDRVAVCTRAPVVELIERRAEHLHPALANLGPDVLVRPVDVDEVRRRAATRPPATSVGALLLDQGVVSGIGNIWRCETLFAERLHPATPLAELPPEALDRLVVSASALMAAAASGERPRARVYRRAGRPCPRCGGRIAAERPPAEQGRTVYWCPRCQPRGLARPEAEPPRSTGPAPARPTGPAVARAERRRHRP